jgi:diguanylate cyclase (GGDEF)-like protein
MRDPLTGLGNRRKLAEDASRWLPARGAAPRLLTVLDLDGFTLDNDTFGHHAGDALLARLGAKLDAGLAGLARRTGSAATSSASSRRSRPTAWRRRSPPASMP